MEKLTAKEEEVMQVLWKMEPCYVKDMVPEFTNPPLHYNTVSTIVRNLEEKGYVGHRAYGNTHEYYAVVAKEDYQNRFVLKKVVSEYFDNSYKNLVSYFAQHEKISADELREILAMIEQKK
ncbi:BlaI/MecI/CopY family transcriptional regulator [Spirosoma taeanense]|uniref:BlaI/MecI/CopY family transcriptional regulator n=1 Tax=Spirosoma taeanense TaxID=2735870 RepID=A0A6M5Y438_9BACT|nr:BlaI/MecI/CopY family transcriptional regulator [Spirosoma taeanense]QJW87903.1 BlaI/MecI/CopY family transcriptional regulator [Spirosoma taeanense]